MHQSSSINFHVYHDQPDLPALILLHGAGGSYLSWPTQIRRMPGCRVYALDLPGHGGSPGMDEVTIPGYASSVMDWMRETGLNTAFLVGHSMGSAIALQIALEHPELVRGLCLLGSAARLRVHPAILGTAANPDTYHKAVELVIRWSFGSKADPKLQLLTARRMAETSREALHADFDACNRFDITSRVDQIISSHTADHRGGRPHDPAGWSAFSGCPYTRGAARDHPSGGSLCHAGSAPGGLVGDIRIH